MTNLISTNFKTLTMEQLQVILDQTSILHQQYREMFYEDRDDNDAMMANLYFELQQGAERVMEEKMDLTTGMIN